jgi:NAD(P)-dependent dehydrogenase (short-subunit alcohol dehydrogenase family)
VTVSVQEQLFDVRGVRAIVTGAASGLGLAMAEVLADCGAHVTLADVDAERLESVTAALGGAARSFVTDVSDEEQVRALVDDVVAAEGGLDVVFANAGIASVPGFGVEDGQTLDTVEPADWDRVLGINLSGVLFTMKHAAAVMKRQGSGRIVVTSSAAGLRPEPAVCYGYAASKAAVLNIVRHAALELAPHGVPWCICPGRSGHPDRRRRDRARRRAGADVVEDGAARPYGRARGLDSCSCSPRRRRASRPAART